MIVLITATCRRHQVSNADFGNLFTIPALAPEVADDPAPEPSSGSSDPPTSATKAPKTARSAAKRTSPNTSAKRRRLDAESTTNTAVASQVQSPIQPISANRSSRRLIPPASSDPYDLENAPSPTNPSRSTPRTAASARPPSRELGSSGPSKPAVQNTAPPQSSPPLPALPTEEVSESPANEPGSGHRRRVRDTEARDSSVILQSVLRTVDSDPADGYMQSSSPLSRLSRKSIAGNLASAKSTRTGLRRSTRLSGSPDEEVNELDPPAEPVDDSIAEKVAHVEGVAQDDNIPEVAEIVIEEHAAAESPEVDEAREIDDREAARRLGRKRPRRNIPGPSPELASQDASEESEPVMKRPRKDVSQPKNHKSPAKQRQPKAPRARKARPETKSRRKPKGDGDEEADSGRSAVGIAVQRFTKIRSQGEDSDEDVLNNMTIHPDRGRVNAIDVLAQICKEVIHHTLKTFKDALREAQDTPMKKELRVKISALGAFHEELRTRLLEHVSRLV